MSSSHCTSTTTMSSYSSQRNETLIPGLPDDLASLILASLPPAHQSRLRYTSGPWHAFLSPRHLLPLRRRLRLPPHHLLCLFPSDPSLIPPYLFDPSSSSWLPLPPLPCTPHLFGLANFHPVFLPTRSGLHLYVLGGSLFDARSYPIGLPRSSSAAHRLDLSRPFPTWSSLPDMLAPRGSFACTALPDSRGIIVAGGGSRHPMYPSDGTRISCAEILDVGTGGWRLVSGLPRIRAGCVGFTVRRHGDTEFWVMGGYGDYRTVSGVVPSVVYYRDAVVLGLRSGKWREVGDMWGAGERRKLGPVAVIEEDEEGVEEPGVFMLESNAISRYNFISNRWIKESSLRRKIPEDESCGFAAMNKELYVLTLAIPTHDALDHRRQPKKRPTLEIQVYDPKKGKWRFLTSNPPFHHAIDFKTAVLCTIQL